jgi:hypothetical protein
LRPIVSLGVLYLFAVLPVAALWGLPFAIPVSIVSMLAFNWLFLPPTHTLRFADSENWVALGRLPRDRDQRERALGSRRDAHEEPRSAGARRSAR